MPNQIKIEGQMFDANKVTLPESGRLFRSAWIEPDDSLVEKVIRLDVAKVGELCHQKRRDWRNWKESQPFNFGKDTFDSDEKSLTRIERLSNLAAKGIDLPKTFTSHTGKEHPVTTEWLDELYAASINHVVSVHEENKKLKTKIDRLCKSKDVDGLQQLFEKLDAEISEGV